jgi:hypothetical protein
MGGFQTRDVARSRTDTACRNALQVAWVGTTENGPGAIEEPVGLAHVGTTSLDTRLARASCGDPTRWPTRRIARRPADQAPSDGWPNCGHQFNSTFGMMEGPPSRSDGGPVPRDLAHPGSHRAGGGDEPLRLRK